MLKNMKSQEQMTDSIENNKKENALPSTNPLLSVNKKKVKLILPNTDNENGITTVSIGVGQDTDSIADDKNQPTITDEYKYTGNLYNNKKHGKGVLSWSDGRMYTGAFFADKRHGFGTFHTPNISEFKGLYCDDERFGPGILIYKSVQTADVGLWLNEDLIRLLCSHPKLRFDIEITDKKSCSSSLLIVPSWYSPEQLFGNISNFHLILKKTSSKIFSNNNNNNNIEDKNSFLSEYIIEHIDRIQETINDKRQQIDAYLSSIYENNDEQFLKENICQERKSDIIPPNQTYEQQQLYNHINKFWPFKQRSLFAIEDIISNTRSSFPGPGPLENGSLNLFEYSYNGDEKKVRELLMERSVYVDVCDCYGLTALHFATYNGHRNVINTLLDFGANVNQLSDDGLTPLSLAFILYYGNNPKQTINTALEHTDPILLNPRISSSLTETDSITFSKQNLINSSSYFATASTIIDETKLSSLLESIKLTDSGKKVFNEYKIGSYGFELKDNLRQRISNEEFRQSVYSVIVLLLRRGGDPSYSDWPLPILALSVRAGDKQMVELLLNNKVQVNCQLNSLRHSNLTPLHIACGCLSSNSVDITEQLLENGAFVNAQSLPGNKEYLSLIDPLVIDINKINEIEQNGRTPLHIICSREENDNTLNIVQLLLQYKGNPNAVCNGQTPLTLAIIVGNESIINLLLNYQTTDPSTPLGLGNGNALCILLSTFHEPRWTYEKRIELIERLIEKTPKVLYPIRFGPKNTLGSSVDFAYYMHSSDTRISQAPYHSLATEDRTRFAQRKELVAYLATRFREEVSKYEDFLRLPASSLDIHKNSESPTNLLSRNTSVLPEKTSAQTKIGGEFRYCATCGRSIGVRLNLCKRCKKYSFCSKTCQVNGWNQFHRDQCRQSLSPSLTLKSSPSRNKNLPRLDSLSIIRIPPKPTNNTKNQLPPLSVAKFLRQKRLKNRRNISSALPTTLDGIKLSINPVYNAPENYSFN